MAEKKPVRSREYILLAQMEQLIEEGLAFDGEDLAAQILSHTDFDNVRSTYQRLAGQMSTEERETFIRFAKSTLKADCPLL
jgi:hypothetical protein